MFDTVTLDTADEIVPVSNNGTDKFIEDEYGHAQIIKKWVAPAQPTEEEIKELEKQACSRIISATTDLEFRKVEGIWKAFTHSVSEDGRCVDLEFVAGDQEANNTERMTAKAAALLSV